MRAKATKATGRAVDAQARREDDGGPRGRASQPTGWPRSSSRRRLRAARPRSPRRAVEVLRLARGLHRRRPGHRQGQPGGHPRASTAPARRPCCGSSAASTGRTPARSSPGHGLKLGYYAQEHETLDTEPDRAGEHAARRAAAHRHRVAQRARLVPVQRRRRDQAGRRAVRRREDPARAGDPGGLQRQRAAARRAHQQPGPRLPRGGAGRHPLATRARSSW